MDTTGIRLAIPAIAVFIAIFIFWETNTPIFLNLPLTVLLLTLLLPLCVVIGGIYARVRNRRDARGLAQHIDFSTDSEHGGEQASK